jgi:hypothetical protein
MRYFFLPLAPLLAVALLATSVVTSTERLALIALSGAPNAEAPALLAAVALRAIGLATVAGDAPNPVELRGDCSGSLVGLRMRVDQDKRPRRDKEPPWRSVTDVVLEVKDRSRLLPSRLEVSPARFCLS